MEGPSVPSVLFGVVYYLEFTGLQLGLFEERADYFFGTESEFGGEEVVGCGFAFGGSVFAVAVVYFFGISEYVL